VAFNPDDLHLHHIIGSYFLSIKFQRAQLENNEAFHAAYNKIVERAETNFCHI
jgi:hypothetical protein